jgi:GTPase SAR1 family protein
MGCTVSQEDRDAFDRNKQIERELKANKDHQKKEIKVLLLGAGESGKSTVVKQMKIIHENGFSTEECLACRELIYGNVVYSMQSIVANLGTLKIEVSPELEEYAKRLHVRGKPVEIKGLPEHIADAISVLWASKPVQEAYQRSKEFQLNDSARYYFDSLDRLRALEYVPTEQDVLRSRVKTTGIVETQFWYKQLHFRMFDVGGQRSERKKWIHCFENVTAIIFCAALSDYDLKLLEDETMNRMHESLQLFESICNSKWFEHTSIILFLNKTDLFREKVATSSLTVCFPEYSGPNDFDQAARYILFKFCELNRSGSKTIYHHLTCATDTDVIKNVFDDVTNIIIHDNLRTLGLI